jgi:enoyl-CoA hydratase/carnithine racemase
MGEPAGAVRFEIRGPIALRTIGRPEARNALNREVFALAEHALDRLAGEPAIRVAVLGGAGERAICAGVDLDELRHLSAEETRQHLRRGHLPNVTLGARCDPWFRAEPFPRSATSSRGSRAPHAAGTRDVA